MKIKYIVYPLLFLLLAYLIYNRLNNGSKEKSSPKGGGAPSEIMVDGLIVKQQDFDNKVSLSGTLEANEQIQIRSEVSGLVKQIYFTEGSNVSAGDLLVKIDDKELVAQLSQANTKEKLAAEVAARAAKLLKVEAISTEEYDNVSAELKSLKAQTQLIRAQIARTEIRAPFSGTIDRLPKKLGSLIDEGELLTSLSDNSQMFAYFNVSEPEYLQYQTDVKDRADNRVSLVLANGETFKEKGNVEVIESEFNNETGNIAFRARFPNSGKLLRNGETGQVQMIVPLKNAIVIPQKATYEIQDKKYVFVIDKNNKVNSREITITGEIPDLYVIKSGITENDRILLEGVQKVKENDKIKFDYESPKEVMNHLRLKAE